MSQPKFFGTEKPKQAKVTQLGYKTIQQSIESNQGETLKAQIVELESQIKLLTQDIAKLESKKTKMNYFIKRDAIDRNGTIFDQMQHINHFENNDEAKNLDSTLSSQYENNPEFQEAMRLVANEEKIHMRNKKPEDWTVAMRFKIRSILEQNYANYKISQNKYEKTYKLGVENLNSLKSDLKKETVKLKTLQTMLKRGDSEKKEMKLSIKR